LTDSHRLWSQYGTRYRIPRFMQTKFPIRTSGWLHSSKSSPHDSTIQSPRRNTFVFSGICHSRMDCGKWSKGIRTWRSRGGSRTKYTHISRHNSMHSEMDVCHVPIRIHFPNQKFKLNMEINDSIVVSDSHRVCGALLNDPDSEPVSLCLRSQNGWAIEDFSTRQLHIFLILKSMQRTQWFGQLLW
jgi:hypothetical protein